MAIKLTPNMMVLWGANIVLKGIAELTDFNFDLETRKAYVQTTLYGETEAIEVWLEDFAIVSDEQSYSFIIQQAQSNRPWLNNLLSHFVGKTWKIPAIPQLTAHIELLAELLKAESPQLEEN
ncbi:MAG: hypothetical protein ACXWTS_00455 [Methylococcaceae bacterium]